MTKNRSALFRWTEHLKSASKLNDAIELYGLECFSFEVIEELDSATNREVRSREQYFINHYDSINKGYNVINSIATPSLVERDEIPAHAVRGMTGLRDLTYITSLNTQAKGGFWRQLESPQANLGLLLTTDTLFNRESSRYYKSLWHQMRTREQNILTLRYLGDTYALTDEKSIRKLFNLIELGLIETHFHDNSVEYILDIIGKKITLHVNYNLETAAESVFYEIIEGGELSFARGT